MKTKVYIAGRITGNAGYKEEFAEARAFYEGHGFVVLDPSAMPEGMEWADYARICAAMIDSADAVVLLPDWEMSPGARLEKAYAEYIRRGVIYHEEMIGERAENGAVRERSAESGEKKRTALQMIKRKLKPAATRRPPAARLTKSRNLLPD